MRGGVGARDTARKKPENHAGPAIDTLVER